MEELLALGLRCPLAHTSPAPTSRTSRRVLSSHVRLGLRRAGERGIGERRRGPRRLGAGYVPSGQDVVGLNLIYAGEGGAPFGGMALGLAADGDVFVRGLPSTMELVTDDQPVAWDRWVCLEAHVAMHAPEGSVELWVDGASRGRLDGIDTFPATGVASMNAGIGHSIAEQPPVRVIIDEVVADDERIGCD